MARNSNADNFLVLAGAFALIVLGWKMIEALTR